MGEGEGGLKLGSMSAEVAAARDAREPSITSSYDYDQRRMYTHIYIRISTDFVAWNSLEQRLSILFPHTIQHYCSNAVISRFDCL